MVCIPVDIQVVDRYCLELWGPDCSLQDRLDRTLVEMVRVCSLVVLECKHVLCLVEFSNRQVYCIGLMCNNWQCGKGFRRCLTRLSMTSADRDYGGIDLALFPHVSWVFLVVVVRSMGGL